MNTSRSSGPGRWCARGVVFRSMPYSDFVLTVHPRKRAQIRPFILQFRRLRGSVGEPPRRQWFYRESECNPVVVCGVGHARFRECDASLEYLECARIFESGVVCRDVGDHVVVAFEKYIFTHPQMSCALHVCFVRHLSRHKRTCLCQVPEIRPPRRKIEVWWTPIGSLFRFLRRIVEVVVVVPGVDGLRIFVDPGNSASVSGLVLLRFVRFPAFVNSMTTISAAVSCVIASPFSRNSGGSRSPFMAPRSSRPGPFSRRRGARGRSGS